MPFSDSQRSREYMRDYMRKRRAVKPGVKPAPAPEIEALRRELAEAREAYHALAARAAEQARKLDRLAKPPPAEGPAADTAKLTREHDAAIAKLAKAQATLADNPSEVAKLRKQIQNLKARLSATSDSLHLTRLANPAALTKRDWRALLKVIQPDTGKHATEAQRTVAAQIFNGLKFTILEE
jgi:chromosome segregation ATPase